MSRSVHLIHEYAHPAARVWSVVIDLDRLKEVMAGLITFQNLPSGPIRQGQDLKVEVSLFGLLPYQPYEMRVERLDPASMTFQSDERGAGVQSWRHCLKVIPTETGCTVSEKIEIEAGPATPVFAAWARYLYGRRHKRRLTILQEIATSEDGAGSRRERG